MSKTTKPKAKAGGVKSRATTKPATRGKATPALAPSVGEKVRASDPLPQQSQPNDADKVAASGLPSPSPEPPAAPQADVLFGQIVALLMRSPEHKFRPLADIEWLVLPGVLTGQCSVARAQQSGATVPVGFVLWASVSTTVDQRLSDLSIPGRLQPDEWRSGDIPWLVELVADARTRQILLKHLGETVFKGREIKMRVRGADGKMQIGTFKVAT